MVRGTTRGFELWEEEQVDKYASLASHLFVGCLEFSNDFVGAVVTRPSKGVGGSTAAARRANGGSTAGGSRANGDELVAVVPNNRELHDGGGGLRPVCTNVGIEHVRQATPLSAATTTRAARFRKLEFVLYFHCRPPPLLRPTAVLARHQR